MNCDLAGQDFKIIAVSNRKLCERAFTEQIERVCQIKPEAIILREKDLSEEEYKILAERIMEICTQYQVRCILHTFWKTAAYLGCTSIHLPMAELRKLPEKEKKQFKEIGTSVHSLEEAEEAVNLGATYLTAGHIYATNCKKGVPPRGLEFLKEVCSKVKLPVYAIGGIRFTQEQWEELKQAGAKGGCIMSGMMNL